MKIRKRWWALCVATAGLATLCVASPAQAAPGDASDGGYSGDNPVILAQIAKLKSEGATYSVASGSYTPTAATKGGPVPNAFPSGCSLTVLLSRSGLLIEGDVYTSCSTAFTAGHQAAALGHYNPNWGTWDEVGYNTTYAAIGTFMHTFVSYNCNNTNASGYKVIGTGTVTFGNQSYTASAYDELTPFLQNCGT